MGSSSKKETARVAIPPAAPKAPLPQATVKLQQTPQPVTGGASSAIRTVPQQSAAPSGGLEVSPVIGIAALVISLVALATQVMMMLANNG